MDAYRAVASLVARRSAGDRDLPLAADDERVERLHDRRVQRRWDVNLLYQGAGRLEGGLTASYEKLIVDAEILQMLAEVLQPLPVDEAALAFEAIAAVGPDGHVFGTAHTLERSTRPRSTGRWSRTGATSRRGRRTARGPSSNEPTPPGSGCSRRLPPMTAPQTAVSDSYAAWPSTTLEAVAFDDRQGIP
jgi:Trimethylamine methyltransferase (MTTB)